MSSPRGRCIRLGEIFLGCCTLPFARLTLRAFPPGAPCPAAEPRSGFFSTPGIRAVQSQSRRMQVSRIPLSRNPRRNITLLLLLAFVAVAGWVAWSGVTRGDHSKSQPYPVTDYGPFRLGETADRVERSAGRPVQYALPPAANARNQSGPGFSATDRLLLADVTPSDDGYRASQEWLFVWKSCRVDVTFDRPKGRVRAIAIYSVHLFTCPMVLGLHDGSSHEEVTFRLGKPSIEQVDGNKTVLRYPQFNLTLHLRNRRVTMIQLAENAVN